MQRNAWKFAAFVVSLRLFFLLSSDALLPLERILAMQHSLLLVRTLDRDDEKSVDVAVVLGHRLDQSTGAPRLRLSSRVKHAVDAFCAAKATGLIFSGARGEEAVKNDLPTEAEAMARYATAEALRVRPGTSKRCPVSNVKLVEDGAGGDDEILPRKGWRR